ncbi:MAG: Rv2231c family pyridoxal phosphate-dependent protein CobC [Actinomycetota bacterium]
MSLALVIGGIRSGKSGEAHALASAAGASVVYVATATASDEEMAARIERHRAGRPSGWRTVETFDPATTLDDPEATVLVDGTGGWIAALMEAAGLFTDAEVAPMTPDDAAPVLDAVRAFAEAAAARPGLTVVVADEAGLGLVPMGAGVRRFVDLLGESSQILAAHAGLVRMVVAGVGFDVKAPRVVVQPDLRVHGDTMVPPGTIDFAVNVAGRAHPAWLRDAMVSALDAAGTYPDERDAIRAIADHHGRDEAEVLTLNGGAEGFRLIAQSLRPSRAAVVHPSFTEPEVALRVAGVTPEAVFRDPSDFTLDPGVVDPAIDLLFVGNPNNPTGTLDPVSTIEKLARPGRVLVVDEAFMPFVPAESESVAGRSDIPGLVVLRSLTKIWSLAGVRAGYALGPPDVIAAMRDVRQPWSVNGPALAALEACVGDTDTPASIAREIAAARETLIDELTNLVEVWPSEANFVLLRVPDGPKVRAALLERGIAVRRADTFPGLSIDHLRIAVRSPDDNATLVAALRDILA